MKYEWQGGSPTFTSAGSHVVSHVMSLTMVKRPWWKRLLMRVERVAP